MVRWLCLVLGLAVFTLIGMAETAARPLAAFCWLPFGQTPASWQTFAFTDRVCTPCIFYYQNAWKEVRVGEIGLLWLLCLDNILQRQSTTGTSILQDWLVDPLCSIHLGLVKRRFSWSLVPMLHRFQSQSSEAPEKIGPWQLTCTLWLLCWFWELTALTDSEGLKADTNCSPSVLGWQLRPISHWCSQAVQ